MIPRKVLIVEDETIVRLHLRQIVQEMGHTVVAHVGTAEEAFEAAAKFKPELVLLDIRLPGSRDGIQIAQQLRATNSSLAFIFVTAYADMETVQRVQEVRALGYIVKPFNKLEIRAALSTALTEHDAYLELMQNQALHPDPSTKKATDAENDSPRTDGLHGLLGRSAPMLKVFQEIRNLSRVDWTVLIEGETGTGKELVARALHALSPRSERPYVAVNCAGLSDTLLTSQLFGHKKGAFTGAEQDQEGLFEAANTGTLFLDEIGDISSTAQKALLRVIEDKHVLRLGCTQPRPVDVRLISATQKNLTEEVNENRFRADLLFRLRIARISLPPLRKRVEDIELLISAFLTRSIDSTGKRIQGFDPTALRCLKEYPWPGNVRELRSAVDFATMSAQSPLIEIEDLPPEIRESHREGSSRLVDVEGLDDKSRVLKALKQAEGNRTQAARLLGISRATLYRRMSDLQIGRDELSS